MNPAMDKWMYNTKIRIQLLNNTERRPELCFRDISLHIPSTTLLIPVEAK